MQTHLNLTTDQILELCDANGRLTQKLGDETSTPEVVVGLYVCDYLHYLSVDGLISKAANAGLKMPKQTSASSARRQILASLKKHLRRTPTADDLLERLRPHCEISEEAAVVIKQDVERLVASLP